VPNELGDRDGWALVLGGGGAIGTAYETGALRALQDAGVDLTSAAVMVGTSGGAFVAASLRLGRSLDEIGKLADARPDPAKPSAAARHFEPAWTTKRELGRRTLGASAVVAGSLLRLPVPRPPERIAKRYPGGLFRVRDQARLAELFPDRWPDAELWVVAYDLHRRRRMVIGAKPTDREISLRVAVLASSAVPGFYEPIQIGDRYLVDGGVTSTTNIDLVTRVGCRTVVCIAPLGCSGGGKLPLRQRVVRRRTIDEMRAADRLDSVLVLQPDHDDVMVQGTNVFRSTGNDEIAQRAYDSTRRTLRESPGARSLLARLVSTS
jgi:NTE family protein